MRGTEQLSWDLLQLFFLLEMSRLNKDQRAALIAEFEQGKESSNPDYYCLKDKSGKITIRKKKPQLTEEDADYVKLEKTLKSLTSQIAAMRPKQSNVVEPAPENPPKPSKKAPKANLL